jgi:hypothetical protein
VNIKKGKKKNIKRERESGGMMKGGTRQGIYQVDFPQGTRNAQLHIAQKSSTYMYTPEALSPLSGAAFSFLLKTIYFFLLFFLLFVCVLLAFSEKNLLKLKNQRFASSNNKGADKVLEHQAKTTTITQGNPKKWKEFPMEKTGYW